MFLDAKAIFYLFNRLSPFLIVSYFVLNSILQMDFKGLIYISGLLLTCCIAKLLGDSNLMNIPSTNEKYNEQCNLLTLGNVDGESYLYRSRFSKIPLSIVVFSYTLSYLIFFMYNSNLISINYPTIILLVYFISVEIYFLNKYNCCGFFSTFTGIFIGTCLAMIWAYVISSSNNTDLYYYNGINNSNYCNLINNETQFICEDVVQ